jgi:hypothetical protein
MNVDTSCHPRFPPTPAALLPLSYDVGNGEPNAPWSTYRTWQEGSDPGPSASSAINDCINPSLLLHSWADDAPPSTFIGLPYTGLLNPDESQSQGAIDSQGIPGSSVPPKSADKAKKKRTKITGEPLTILERRFDLGVYPDAEELAALALSTGFEYKSVKYWFENRRRLRKKSKGEFKFRPKILAIMSLIHCRRIKGFSSSL